MPLLLPRLSLFPDGERTSAPRTARMPYQNNRCQAGVMLSVIGRLALSKQLSETQEKLGRRFEVMYAQGGRPSIAPEKLLRALLYEDWRDSRPSRRSHLTARS